MNGPGRFRRARLEALSAWLPLAGVGVVLLAAALWNFWRELQALQVRLPPLVAAAMTVSLSLAVVYAAVSLREEDLDDDAAWTVVGSSLVGGAFAAAAEGLTLLVRVAEGRPVGEPQFPMLVVGSFGILAGFVVGRYYVRARQSAQEAKEARDAMAFTNSLLRHDVLNGIQVIRGNAGVLAEHGDASVRERAEAIAGRTDELVTLVTEVRSVAAVLTDDVEVEPVDLAALLDEVTESVDRSHADATVETALPDRLAVSGSDALRPVFSNLLTNAIKHGGESVRVRVSGSVDGGTASVHVADDGPGIPPERRERVFEQGATTDGGGQGLYVADTIVRRLGGDIRVTESEWGGAEFVVTLPAADSE